MKKDLVAFQLVKFLEARGVKNIFGLCGHTIIGFLDALKESSIRFISVRHEQIAAHAADGYARGKGSRVPGVLLTHLGPGLANATTGVAEAAELHPGGDRRDVPSCYFGRHPHQEVNLHADASQYEIFRPFVKRAWRVDRPELLPEVMTRPSASPSPAGPARSLYPFPWTYFMEPDTRFFDHRIDNAPFFPVRTDENCWKDATYLAEATRFPSTPEGADFLERPEL
ncbi:hypothetical protein MASR2M17_12430 [Aminivibrio sp.]